MLNGTSTIRFGIDLRGLELNDGGNKLSDDRTALNLTPSLSTQLILSIILKLVLTRINLAGGPGGINIDTPTSTTSPTSPNPTSPTTGMSSTSGIRPGTIRLLADIVTDFGMTAERLAQLANDLSSEDFEGGADLKLEEVLKEVCGPDNEKTDAAENVDLGETQRDNTNVKDNTSSIRKLRKLLEV